MGRNAFTAEQETWLKALESGEWSQAKYKLKAAGGFCCLGVACEIGLANGNENYNELDLGDDNRLRMRGPAGQFLRPDDYGALVEMNDSGKTFSEIAAFIRANPWQVFTNFDA